MQTLRIILDNILPSGGWDRLMAYGNVSRLDVATDIEGARMRHLHVLPKQILTTAVYKKAAKLETITIGKSKGNQLTAYSRSAKAAAEGKPLPVPTVRVEKRMKSLGRTPLELASMDNPLLGFTLVATPPDPPPGEDKPSKVYIWKLFQDSVARHTLGPALKLLPSAKMSRYRKHYKGHEQPWWDAEKIWGDWPATLKAMRLVSTKDWPDE